MLIQKNVRQNVFSIPEMSTTSKIEQISSDDFLPNFEIEMAMNAR